MSSFLFTILLVISLCVIQGASVKQVEAFTLAMKATSGINLGVTQVLDNVSIDNFKANETDCENVVKQATIQVIDLPQNVWKADSIRYFEATDNVLQKNSIVIKYQIVIDDENVSDAYVESKMKTSADDGTFQSKLQLEASKSNNAAAAVLGAAVVQGGNNLKFGTSPPSSGEVLTSDNPYPSVPLGAATGICITILVIGLFVVVWYCSTQPQQGVAKTNPPPPLKAAGPGTQESNTSSNSAAIVASPFHVNVEPKEKQQNVHMLSTTSYSPSRDGSLESGISIRDSHSSQNTTSRISVSLEKYKGDNPLDRKKKLQWKPTR